MANVRIVTDSTADIPEAVRQNLRIESVPLKVIFGEEAYLDGVEITPEQFYAKLRQVQELPKTSQPSPAEFQAVYERLLAEDKHASIISIHLSSAFSGTMQSASLAKSLVGETADITVVDSRSASYVFGMAVVKAAEAALANEDKAAILDKINRSLAETRVYFLVDTLEYLQKGGRIGKAAALLGTLLQIKPVLSIDQEGEVFVVDKMRGKKKALQRIFELLDKAFARVPVQVCVLHADSPDEAEAVKASLKERFMVEKEMILPIGPVIGAHAGPGTIGIVVSPL
jgi:DegV family protein with EDD domain